MLGEQRSARIVAIWHGKVMGKYIVSGEHSDRRRERPMPKTKEENVPPSGRSVPSPVSLAFSATSPKFPNV